MNDEPRKAVYATDPKTWPVVECEPTDVFLGEFVHDCTPHLTDEQKSWPVVECVPTDVFLTPVLVVDLTVRDGADTGAVALGMAELLHALSVREEALGGSGLVYDGRASRHDQSDGPKSDALVIALNDLLTRAVREAADGPIVIDEAALLPPDDPEAVAQARKVESRLDHYIEQHSAANPQRQEEYRELAAKPEGHAELLERQQDAERAVREVVARLLRRGVLALESLATENAEVAK